jgi:hypothetical protein
MRAFEIPGCAVVMNVDGSHEPRQPLRFCRSMRIAPLIPGGPSASYPKSKKRTPLVEMYGQWGN